MEPCYNKLIFLIRQTASDTHFDKRKISVKEVSCLVDDLKYLFLLSKR